MSWQSMHSSLFPLKFLSSSHSIFADMTMNLAGEWGEGNFYSPDLFGPVAMLKLQPSYVFKSSFLSLTILLHCLFLISFHLPVCQDMHFTYSLIGIVNCFFFIVQFYIGCVCFLSHSVAFLPSLPPILEEILPLFLWCYFQATWCLALTSFSLKRQFLSCHLPRAR